jgi:hypothetical protein
MKRLFILGLASATMFLASFHAKADVVTPFGDTTGTGPWDLTSTASTSSGVEVDPSASITFAQLLSLSATFTDISGGAYGGSPRISVGLQDGANENFLHIFLGTSPNYTDSNPAAFTTAASGVNVIGNNDAGRYDDSQFAGGSPFTTYAATLALMGSLSVVEFDVVLDGGWGANGNQELTLNSLDYSVAATPLPATLPLFASGLGALGLLGWRRKRKNAATIAAWSKHLVVFRRDRRAGGLSFCTDHVAVHESAPDAVVWRRIHRR